MFRWHRLPLTLALVAAAVRSAALSSSGGGQPPLPDVCDPVKQGSQGILDALNAFDDANKYCYAEMASCVKSVQYTTCSFDCTANDNEFGQSCVDSDGYYCDLTITAPNCSSCHTWAFQEKSATCLPSSCGADEASAMTAVLKYQYCGGDTPITGCDVDLSCDFGLGPGAIVGIVLGIIAGFVCCVVCVVYVRRRCCAAESHNGEYEYRMMDGDDEGSDGHYATTDPYEAEGVYYSVTGENDAMLHAGEDKL